MPWPIRSTQFILYAGTPTANTSTAQTTVPTGKKWLIKDWSVYNAGASSRTVTLTVTRSGTVYVLDIATVASAQPNGNPNRHIVLNAGDTLAFQTSVAQAIHFQCSGAQLG